MQKQVNYQQLKYSTSKSTLGNMAHTEIGKMNGIIFTVSLFHCFRNEMFNNLCKRSRVETRILITHLPLACCMSHSLFGPQACNMRKKVVTSLTGIL